jgi:hypothetical protein
MAGNAKTPKSTAAEARCPHCGKPLLIARADTSESALAEAREQALRDWERVKAMRAELKYPREPYSVDTPASYETRMRTWSNLYGVRLGTG